MSAQQEDREGDLRARELFHYFQPDNPALMPNGQRSNRPCETPTIEKQSPNLVLTALAQLAALKLGVQRAVIRYASSLPPGAETEFVIRALSSIPSISLVAFVP